MGFSLHHRVQTDSGAHPASYSVSTRGWFPGVKQPDRETDHSPPTSAEVKNAWGYTRVCKSFRTGRLERELQMAQLPATRCSCIAILWVSLVSFAAIILCVASQRVFIVVLVYFVIDSVRNLLDIPSYFHSPIRLHGVVLSKEKHRGKFSFYLDSYFINFATRNQKLRSHEIWGLHDDEDSSRGLLGQTPCGHVERYQRFGGASSPCWGRQQGPPNVGTLPNHYTASQPRRPWPESEVMSSVEWDVVRSFWMTNMGCGYMSPILK
jgi:hypothetical protein